MSTSPLPERGLVIRRPWVDLIAAGVKTWEIRRRPTKVRGTIGLIAGGTGTVIGEATLVDCLGPFQPADLSAFEDRHQVPADQLVDYAPDAGLYAWVMDDVVAYPQPKPYTHPAGAVIFVTLTD